MSKQTKPKKDTEDKTPQVYVSRRVKCKKCHEYAPNGRYCEKHRHEILRKMFISGLRTMKGPETIRDMASKDKLFDQLCSLTGMKPTRRQYSKFLCGRGGCRTLLRAALDSRLGYAQLALKKKVDELQNASRQLKHFSPEQFGFELENKGTDIPHDKEEWIQVCDNRKEELRNKVLDYTSECEKLKSELSMEKDFRTVLIKNAA